MPARRSLFLPCATVVAAACVALLAACGGGLQPASGGPAPATPSTSTDTSGAQTETATQDHPGVDRVEISADAADVVLRQGPDGASRVERTLRWTGERPEVTETVVGSVLRITSRCPDGRAGRDHCSVRLVVTVPAAAAAGTDVGAGDVTVSDLAGAQDHRTSSGDVRATGLRAGQLGARTSAGDVDVAFATAPQQVDVESSAGDVTVTVPAGRYQVQASTSVGDVDVRVHDDPAATARIVARSSVGDVTVGSV